MIADDELKIRQGLFEAVNWSLNGIDFVGFAKNGREALELVEVQQPDICLIDICMPLLNGIDLIQSINRVCPGALCIVITGHDEFTYAQQAIRLQVFDYILKPVDEPHLNLVIERAVDTVNARKTKDDRYALAEKILKSSLPILKEQFFRHWINGVLTREEIDEQMKLHQIDTGETPGVLLMHPLASAGDEMLKAEWDSQLLNFALRNVFEELLVEAGRFWTFMDDRDNLFAWVDITNNSVWETLPQNIESAIYGSLGQRVQVMQTLATKNPACVPELYDQLLRQRPSILHPLVAQVKDHIEKEFGNPELSFGELADAFFVSVGYLSRLFKRDVGITFNEYLLRFRMQKALEYMNKPQIRISEIAERTGFSSQHYFSSAFRKFMGISPSEYRQQCHCNRKG